MPDWFGQEIDRVAMRLGLSGSDDYLDGFEWSDELEEPGDAGEVADAVVARLDAQCRGDPSKDAARRALIDHSRLRPPVHGARQRASKVVSIEEGRHGK
jgi:hypothetical protein